MRTMIKTLIIATISGVAINTPLALEALPDAFQGTVIQATSPILDTEYAHTVEPIKTTSAQPAIKTTSSQPAIKPAINDKSTVNQQQATPDKNIDANIDTVDLSNEQFTQLVKQGVPAPALSEALKARQWAIKKGKVKNFRYMTVVEFNQPSSDKRMQVIDLYQDAVVSDNLVSQGSGSQTNSKGIPTNFSDIMNSRTSVSGALVTANIYYGKHGQSLRLKGLEASDKNVLVRDVVIHPAPYSTESYLHETGRLGRSWGCFAVAPSIAEKIIPLIKNGSFVYAYAPQADLTRNYS